MTNTERNHELFVVGADGIGLAQLTADPAAFTYVRGHTRSRHKLLFVSPFVALVRVVSCGVMRYASPK